MYKLVVILETITNFNLPLWRFLNYVWKCCECPLEFLDACRLLTRTLLVFCCSFIWPQRISMPHQTELSRSMQQFINGICVERYSGPIRSYLPQLPEMQNILRLTATTTQLWLITLLKCHVSNTIISSYLSYPQVPKP